MQNDRGSSVGVTETRRFLQWLDPNGGNGAQGVPKPGSMSFAAMATRARPRREMRPRGRAVTALMCVAVTAGLAPGHASADAIAVTTLADTTTPNPLGGGPFSGFTRDQGAATSLGPALDGGVVAFIGGNALHPGSPFAVPAGGGAITSIANDSTLMPGEPDLPTAEFISLGGFSLDGDTVVFVGSGFKQNIAFGEPVGGVYRETGGALEAVVNTTTAIPGRAGSFSPFSFGRPSADGGQIAFCVQSTGIYATTASGLVVVADDATPIPGGVGNFPGNFGNPDDVSLDGGDVVFTASVPVGPFVFPAIFKTTGGVEGTLERIVDTDMTVPGSAESFGAVANPVLSGGNLVFWGRTASTLRDGVYTTIGGSLRVVADRNTPVPGGTGNFIGFASNAGLSIAGERIAFLGFGEDGSQGIYVWDAGVIWKVIDSRDSIDDRNVLLLDFNKEAFSGSAIVFVANFAGNFLQGVYVAPVPEPGSIAMQLAALGGLFAVARLRTQPKC